MSRLSTVVSAILLTASTLTFAEPTPTIRYLIGEPASLLDIGLLHLEMLFHSLTAPTTSAMRIDGNEPLVEVGYNWSENRILVNLVYLAGIGRADADVEADCKRVIDQMRNMLSGPDESGRAYIERVFAHSGYDKKNAPANFGTELASVVITKVTLLYRNKTSTAPQTMICEGKLSSATVSVTSSAAVRSRPRFN